MDLTCPTDLVRDVDGRKVSPAVFNLFARMRELEVPRLDELGVEGAREAVETSVRGQRRPESVDATDRAIPSSAEQIATRTYRAERDEPTPGRAVIIYFHGGGWVTGSLDTADATCRELALATGLDVVSVEYRRAPEHPFPAAVDDAVAAVMHIAAEYPDRLLLAGDSAGGFVALQAASALAHLVTDLMLFYPAVRPPAEHPPHSWIENQDDPILPAKTMQWFWEQFRPERGSAPVRPTARARFQDAASFPRTFIVTCGLDVLRDEGNALASDLAAAGIEVRRETYPGAPHGFFSFTKRLPFGDDAIERARRWLHA